MVTCFDLDAFNSSSFDSTDAFQYFVYQVEECPHTGAWHVQGYLELKRQMSMNQVKGLFCESVHLEPRRGSQQQAIAYCTKTETRKVEPLHFGTPSISKQGQREDLEEARVLIASKNSWNAVLTDPGLTNTVARHLGWAREVFNSRTIAAPLPDIVLRMWQERVMSLITAGPVKRQIIWIWSYASGTGKTTFFDYVSAKFTVIPGADWTNTLYCYDGEQVVWFDRTRSESNDDKSTDSFYRDLEKWSNCTMHTSTKYVVCRKLVNAVIVVTANVQPDEPRLPGRFLTVEAKTAIQEKADFNAMLDDDETDCVMTEPLPMGPPGFKTY